MLRGLIDNAKLAADSLVARYVVRASVAVPFLIALGFATAAVALMLIEKYGHRDAYLLIAGGFATIGLLSALIVRSREHEQIVVDEKTAKSDTAEIERETATAAAAQLPMALLAALFSSPGSTAAVARALGRNIPLILLLVGMGALFWPGRPETANPPEDDSDETHRRSNGFDHTGNSAHV